MAKKVTISVPNELHEKMQKWRESFNFSSIFQEAIASAIEKKEAFKKRLREVTTMEQVVERLRREKVEVAKDYFEQGKKDGLEWAKAASYDEIQYALQWETVDKTELDTPGLIGTDPTRNEVLGDYFGDVIEDDSNMGFIETIHGHYMPNEYFISWEAGWKEAVEEFWHEIKDKL